MTVSARTVETNAADALAEFFANVGDTDNAEHWVKRLEGSFSSPIVRAETFESFVRSTLLIVTLENGRVLHLTVTQVKEAKQP